MRIVLEEKDKEVLGDILQCLPEYSVSMRCTHWKYVDSVFEFVDDEDGSGYTMTFDMAWAAWQKWLDLVADGKLHYGISMDGLMDAGNYDANMVDDIVQIACLGEVTYG